MPGNGFYPLSESDRIMSEIKTLLKNEFSRHAAILGGLALFWLFVYTEPDTVHKMLALPAHMTANILPTVITWFVGCYLATWVMLWVADSYRRGPGIMIAVVAAIWIGWIFKSPVLLGFSLAVVYFVDVIRQKTEEVQKRQSAQS